MGVGGLEGVERGEGPAVLGEVDVAGWVAENGEPARINDTEEDDRFKKGGGFSIRSILTVPMWAGGQVVGVLGATSPKPNLFSDEHEILAMLLANCAAPAIEKARIKRLAVTDQHTKAYDPRYYFPRLGEEIRNARRYVSPVAVLLFSLDGLDQPPEEMDDRLLRSFADRVKGSVRRTDILVRRREGRFALITPFTHGHLARELAERIRRDFSENELDCGEGNRVLQTVSVGVAVWNGSEEPDELNRRARFALAAAEEKGGNLVLLAPEVLPEGD